MKSLFGSDLINNRLLKLNFTSTYMKHFYFLSILCFTNFIYAQLTPPSELQAYYTGVNFSNTGLTLKSQLSTKTTDKHINYLSYSEVWNALKITDEDPNNSNNVLLVYGFNDSDSDTTNDRSRAKSRNGGGSGDWNREHVYAKSLGTPNLGTSGPGADAQMLRPSDVQRNSNRGSKKFAAGNGGSGNFNSGWYPGDEWKGDCARIIMYMYIHYGSRCLPTNVGIGSSASTPDDMISLFLQWNAEDPVSSIEITRNDYHSNTNNTYAQGNRNPFIDNPYLATVIWGGPNAENRWENLSIDEFTQNSVKIFPNPVQFDEVTIEANLAILAEVYDILGKKVLTQIISENQKKLNIAGLSKGIYMIKLNSEKGYVTKKLIRQ